METIALKLAEILEVSIDRAIELYPIIKSQFIAYSILGNIGLFLEFIFIISIIGIVLSGVFTISEYCSLYKDEDDSKLYKKILKIFAITTLVLAILLVGTNALKYILASDFMIIKEFLN